MDRRNISSGAEWEDQVGYSRAVRVDGRVLVSGTTATNEDGEIMCEGDMYGQCMQALGNVETALDEAGSGVEDVVRTRIYVTDIDDWREVAEAHREWFGDVRPAATMVEVNRLVSPELLVEIEAEAMVSVDED